jgi:hypothetical protein
VIFSICLQATLKPVRITAWLMVGEFTLYREDLLFELPDQIISGRICFSRTIKLHLLPFSIFDNSQRNPTVRFKVFLNLFAKLVASPLIKEIKIGKYQLALSALVIQILFTV